MTQVILVCGVGGAGKTTLSAALAVAHAQAGLRTVVLTIDPARRLADALGIEALGNDPTEVPLGAAARLDALMLDRKATWDALVRDHASDDAVTERLFANRYYRAVSERLTGGHELMAVEKLHTLLEAGTWDVIVVDTPPARHALDFLHAPQRIQRVLDQRLLAALLRPSSGLLGIATRRVASVIRRLAGESVLDDLREFFELIASLSDGFKERSARVQQVLAAERAQAMIVATADDPRTEELLAFVSALSEHKLRFAGVLLNRTTDAPGVSVEQLDHALDMAPDTPPWPAVRAALQHFARLQHTRAARHDALASTLASHTRAEVWAVRELSEPAATLDALKQLAAQLPTSP